VLHVRASSLCHACAHLSTLSLHAALPIWRTPSVWPRARLVRVKRETAQIAASASPRKPSVAIPSRSSSPPSLEVACRSSASGTRSEEHTSELQSRSDLVCRILLEKKK